MSPLMESHRIVLSFATAWRNKRSYSMHWEAGWLAKNMTIIVWYFASSSAWEGWYTRKAHRKRFQASNQVGRSVTKRLGDLSLVRLGTFEGCSSGGVSTGKSNLLKSRYLPFRIRSVSR